MTVFAGWVVKRQFSADELYNGGEPLTYKVWLFIDRYAVLVNSRKAGFGLASMVQVSLARHEQSHVEHFIREVLRHPEVLECFATSGEADFHLRVVVEDIDAYNTFLDDFVFKLPGVSQVRSNIVLKEIKADTALPFR